MSGSILINYSYCAYQQIPTQLLVCFPIKCYLDFMSVVILRDSGEKNQCLTMDSSLKSSGESVPENVKKMNLRLRNEAFCVSTKICFHLAYCI